jgi:hypothetical protein
LARLSAVSTVTGDGTGVGPAEQRSGDNNAFRFGLSDLRGWRDAVFAGAV